jgi:tRNA (cmo5U34)-methyltransferase
MPDNDTLCGWGNKDKVAYFLANAEVIVPRRAEQLSLLTGLLPFDRDEKLSLLDLGAGFGAVTECLLERFRRATVTCVDGSEAMVARATKRLEKYGERVKVFKADLAVRSWSEVLHPAVASGAEKAVFDAVVSAIAIHHLTDERKRELDLEVFRMLAGGGIFLNNDVVATPPDLKARFEALNLAAIQQQERALRGAARPVEQIQTEMREQLRLAGGEHHSRIAPLIDQLAWLREAGFQSVDCYWRYLDLAIFGGVKEARGQ